MFIHCEPKPQIHPIICSMDLLCVCEIFLFVILSYLFTRSKLCSKISIKFFFWNFFTFLFVHQYWSLNPPPSSACYFSLLIPREVNRKKQKCKIKIRAENLLLLLFRWEQLNLSRTENKQQYLYNSCFLFKFMIL